MGIPVAFDVNLRANLWESLDSAREQISPILDLATIAKLSDDELSPVLGVESPEAAADVLLERGVSLVRESGLTCRPARHTTGGTPGRMRRTWRSRSDPAQASRR